MTEQLVKKPTNCNFCGYQCAFIATVEQGRVIALEPDTSRYPYDESILASCRRWRMNLGFLDGENRINYPLKRMGERGLGQWQQVSWDTALDDIVAQLKALFEAYGPHTLASAIGGPHASFWPLHRFMNLVGSPNNMGIGQICWNPRIWMDVITFGWTIEADITPGVTEVLFLWGTNPAASDNSAFWRSIIQFSKSDAPLVVVDPRFTQAARLADLWLPIKPGTDCVLALSMIQAIIEEGLCDADFVEQWCIGFEELEEHVAPFRPENVAPICGIAAEDIRRAALLFGSAGASALVSGRGIDQIGPDVAPTHRAICCLRAITGNIDKPGTCIMTEMSDFIPEVDMEMSDLFPSKQRKYCLNTSLTPLQSYEGYDRIAQVTAKQGYRLPVRYMTSAHPDLVLKAMESGDPYPVRALIVQATNPVLTYADTHRVFKALESLDLLVVLEHVMTPTAALADYVLPIAGAIERPLMQVHGGVANMAYGGPAAVQPYYQRKTDYEVFRELGLRMGQAEFWPQASLEEAFEASLAPVGIDWEEFCRRGIYWRTPIPYKFELLNGADELRGFATTSGKIELKSALLEEMGGDSLPTPSEKVWAKVSSDLRIFFEQFTKGDASSPLEAESLTLLTGARKQPFNASMFLDNADFRKKYPYPKADMNQTTADRLGLVEGEEIILETEKGSATFMVAIAEMRNNVISADYAWWYPEVSPYGPDFGGIWDSNINLLTDCSVENGEAAIGTWSYNALECKVRKAEAGTLSKYENSRN